MSRCRLRPQHQASVITCHFYTIYSGRPGSWWGDIRWSWFIRMIATCTARQAHVAWCDLIERRAAFVCAGTEQAERKHATHTWFSQSTLQIPTTHIGRINRNLSRRSVDRSDCYYFMALPVKTDNTLIFVAIYVISSDNVKSDCIDMTL